MKTRRQKVVFKYMAIFTCILLCASFFCIPVSAASYTAVFNFPISDGADPPLNYCRVFPIAAQNDYSSANTGIFSNAPTAHNAYIKGPAIDPAGVVYEYDWVSSSAGVVSIMLGQSSFGDLESFVAGDTAFMNPGQIDVIVASDYTAFATYRFVLRSFDADFTVGSVVAATDPLDAKISNMSGEGTFRLIFDKLPFNFISSISGGNYIGLALCIEFYGTSMNSVDLALGSFNATVSTFYGTGSDPNYPIYGGADSGNLGNLESQEQELLDSASGGINDGINAITGFKNIYQDLNLFVFPMRLATMLNGLTDIPGIFGLVMVSLSLGLFASLLALAGSIISAADRKAGQAKREAAAAERAAKREKFYASRR